MILFFFFNDTATTEIYTLSLHDALPISHDDLLKRRLQCGDHIARHRGRHQRLADGGALLPRHPQGDRKSTRLNSSHANISYVVFCLKKKKCYNSQSPYGDSIHFLNTTTY